VNQTPLGTVSYQYDAANRRTRITYPGTTALYVGYVRDVTGQVTHIRENGATATTGNAIAAYAYDDLARRSSVTLGNGVVTGYAFDPISRLASLTHNLDGAATTNDITHSFTYNSASQILTRTRSNDLYGYAGALTQNEITTLNGLNQATDIAGTAQGHDLRGIIISSGGAVYGYSAENMMTSAVTGSIQFYDATTLHFYTNCSAMNIAIQTRSYEVIRLIIKGILIAISLSIAAYANPPLSIRNLWTLEPITGGNTLNQVKGTLRYRVNNETSDRTLISYGNGVDGKSMLHQCVELIKRYAAALGFPATALGDGKYVAANFAKLSSGAFVYVANGAPNLPKPGAVLSIDGWDALPPGHVGIICNHSDTDAASGTVRIKLFDQNMPVDVWKEITFRNIGGKWFGVMVNKGVERPVVGWADPAG
jgi:RHS Repeat